MNAENAQKAESTESTRSSAAPAAGPDPAERPQTAGDRLQPRSGPIVWGVIVLTVCAYSATRLLSPGTLDTGTWLIAATIGLGALLLVIGAAVTFRGRR